MSRKIEDLIPEAQEKCRDFLNRCKEAGLHVHIAMTRRTQAEQDAIYAQGRHPLAVVNEMRGKVGFYPIKEKENVEVSWTTHPPHVKGIAWDIYIQFKPSEDADYKSPAALEEFQTAGRIAFGMGLVWGGNFIHHPDSPHFQLPG